MRLYVLPCDGIGPEITHAAIEVLEAAHKRYALGLSYHYDDVGFVSLQKYGTRCERRSWKKPRPTTA
jgi:3-isopropylmalate dehydrogenase